MEVRKLKIIKVILLFIIILGYVRAFDFLKLMKSFSRDAFVPMFTSQNPNFMYLLQNKLYFVLVPTLLFLFFYIFYTKGFNRGTVLIIVKLLFRYASFLIAVILGYFISLILVKDVLFSPPEMKPIIIAIFMITGFLYFTVYDILGKKPNN
ncbi:hypothetical protein A2121_01065 [Candidatus Nomurabacteria bacterium GWB1_40_6]|uniref:Uncharacterized protein n=1 Tax=Candidatus Nomurabacteria bacterium GWB1_40_6 TaxID=1801727 RepID=A0A1F6TMS7_9BACT|nr:MAG: hypothetical protein A2121_01065 [Candidatus Nomurabacteria bacterium GWB1_40_6]